MFTETDTRLNKFIFNNLLPFTIHIYMTSKFSKFNSFQLWPEVSMFYNKGPSTSSKRNDYKFDYRVIVFALLHNIRLDEHQLVKSLFKRRSIFIAEHPPDESSNCEYNTLHYHGLIEIVKGSRFDNDRIINDIKKHCTFFKSQNAIAPVHFLAYMQIPPRHIIFKNSLPTPY